MGAVVDPLDALICLAAAVLFGTCFFWSIVKVDGDLSVVLLALSFSTVFFLPYLVYVFAVRDISSAGPFVLAAGVLRAVYLTFLCRATQLGELTTVLAPFGALSVLGVLATEAVFGGGSLRLGAADACAVSLAVVGAAIVAVRLACQADPQRVTNDEFEVTIDADCDDDDVVYDANPFETRQPKPSRLRRAKATVSKAVTRHAATQLGAAAGAAFGVALSVERHGSAAMGGEFVGFWAAVSTVALAAAWPASTRLTDRGAKAPSEHSLTHLLGVAALGTLTSFWLTSAVSLDPSVEGVARSAVAYCAVAPVAALLARCGLGEAPLDLVNSAAAVLVGVGAGVAMFLSATAAA